MMMIKFVLSLVSREQRQLVSMISTEVHAAIKKVKLIPSSDPLHFLHLTSFICMLTLPGNGPAGGKDSFLRGRVSSLHFEGACSLTPHLAPLLLNFLPFDLLI